MREVPFQQAASGLDVVVAYLAICKALLERTAENGAVRTWGPLTRYGFADKHKKVPPREECRNAGLYTAMSSSQSQNQVAFGCDEYCNLWFTDKLGAENDKAYGLLLERLTKPPAPSLEQAKT